MNNNQYFSLLATAIAAGTFIGFAAESYYIGVGGFFALNVIIIAAHYIVTAIKEQKK